MRETAPPESRADAPDAEAGPSLGRLYLRAAATASAAVVGLYGMGATVSYAPSDPSLNVAGEGEAKNLFGAPGAAFADVAVQTLGAGAPLAMTALCAAGVVRFARKEWLEPVSKPRLLAGAAGVGLVAGAASTLPAGGGWPLAAGLGGVLGDGLAALVTGLFALPGLPFAPVLAGLSLGAAGAFALGWALHIQRDHVGAAADAASRAAARAGQAAQRAIGYVAQRTRREEQAWDLYAQPRLDHQRQTAPLDASFDAVEPQPAPRPAPRAAEAVRPQAAPAAPPQTAPRPFAPPPPTAAPAARASRVAPQPPPSDPEDAFQLPALDLLSPPKPRSAQLDEAALADMAERLAEVLADYGVQGEILSSRPGPVVTLFEFEPAPGVRAARVIGLAEDIARSMSATAARVAVIPGRNAIGIELPNPTRETVYLRSMLGSRVFAGAQGSLVLALGETIEGEAFFADLAKMPHLLIAGTTGSGKSVGINAMILSLLYRHTPEQCKMIMIDPKVLELSVYEGIPHLLSPVVTEPKKAVVALKWTVREMEERYRRMAKLGVRNITGYNERIAEAIKNGERLEKPIQTGFDPDTGAPTFENRALPLDHMPYIVVIIDEMAELMATAGKEIEAAVQRLAQMARAAGIHVIMATQRPSVDVITGTIKANFPTRISYWVTSKIDSRTILGEQGAEQLLGQGDLLYMAGGGRIRRLHGPFVSDNEVERVVEMLKAQGAPDYRHDVTEEDDGSGSGAGGGEETGELFESSGDDLYDRAVAIVARERKATTSYLQRCLSVGYNRAANLIERMEKEGLISTANSQGKREVLMAVVNDM